MPGSARAAAPVGIMRSIVVLPLCMRDAPPHSLLPGNTRSACVWPLHGTAQAACSAGLQADLGPRTADAALQQGAQAPHMLLALGVQSGMDSRALQHTALHVRAVQVQAQDPAKVRRLHTARALGWVQRLCRPASD